MPMRLSLDFQSLGTACTAVLMAWRDEWARLTPGWLKKFFQDPGHELVLSYDEGAFAVSCSRSSACYPLGRLNADAPNKRQLLSDLIDQSARPIASATRARVVLPPSLVLSRTLQFPNAPIWTLRKAVRYEIERLSPLELSQISFDFKVLKRDRATGKASIEVRLIRRDLLDRLRSECKSAGVRISALILSGPHDHPWSGFPVQRSTAFRSYARQRALPLLMGLTFSLGAAVLGITYSEESNAEQAIVHQIEHERSEANVARETSSQVAAVDEQIRFFNELRGAPLLVAILTDLSALVPDGTWLTEAQLSTGNVRIRGNSNAPPDLLDRLEESARFMNARIASPSITSGTNTYFDMSLDVTPPEPPL